MKRRPLIIDTDPGVDDAIAILLALASPELDLLGICAVAGNVPLAATQDNTRRICELAGRPDIPVYAGCPRPCCASRFSASTAGCPGWEERFCLRPPCRSCTGTRWISCWTRWMRRRRGEGKR